jgi:hypothetical protein
MALRVVHKRARPLQVSVTNAKEQLTERVRCAELGEQAVLTRYAGGWHCRCCR